MKIKCLMFVFALMGTLQFSQAQTRQILNTSACSHMVEVQWADLSCNDVILTTHMVGPMSINTIFGPGGPMSPLFLIRKAAVDGETAFGNVGCGIPAGTPLFTTCALGANLVPGVRININ